LVRGGYGGIKAFGAQPLVFQILERAVLKFDFVARKMEIEDFTAVDDGIPL
jgi:hypothetical protein